MKIGKTLYAKNRTEWRSWLKKNHKSAKEIWLVYYKKNSGKPRIPYNDAVEEALCFGWIDSILKSIDEQRFVQRFTPRKPKAQWSATNIERLRRLMKQKKVAPAGLEAARDVLGLMKGSRGGFPPKASSFKIAADILTALKKDPSIWINFKRFPESYKRIRIGWIDSARKRPDVFRQRLNYFLKMTAKDKKFGMVQ